MPREICSTVSFTTTSFLATTSSLWFDANRSHESPISDSDEFIQISVCSVSIFTGCREFSFHTVFVCHFFVRDDAHYLMKVNKKKSKLLGFVLGTILFARTHIALSFLADILFY